MGMRKTSLIPCLEGKVLNVLHLPWHMHWQFPMSRPSWHINYVVVWCAIPITTNSFHNMGGARHLWWKWQQRSVCFGEKWVHRDFSKNNLSLATKECLFWWNNVIQSKMSSSTHVMKWVGCDRNGTSHVRVGKFDKFSINYITQPRS
jgi:hypothetical protein